MICLTYREELLSVKTFSNIVTRDSLFNQVQILLNFFFQIMCYSDFIPHYA